MMTTTIPREANGNHFSPLFSGHPGFLDRRDRHFDFFSDFKSALHPRGFNIAQLSRDDFFHFYQFSDITLVAVGVHLQDRFDV